MRSEISLKTLKIITDFKKNGKFLRKIENIARRAKQMVVKYETFKIVDNFVRSG